MLTPSEIEWLKQDSAAARETFTRLAAADERLSQMILVESERAEG